MNRPTLRGAANPASSASTRTTGLKDRQVGQQIRRHRLLRRLTQAGVAAQVGVSCRQLHKYEDGSSGISIDRLCSLAAVLNVPVTRFFIGDDRREPPSEPAGGPPSRQEQLLRHVEVMPPAFQQAVLRLAKALAAEAPASPERRPRGAAPSAATDQVPTGPGFEPSAEGRHRSPIGAAGSSAAAAVLRARRRR